MRDDLPKIINNNSVFMYNMDSKNGNGSHWVCVGLHFPSIFYFDPFGTKILNGFPPMELRIWGKHNGYKIIYASENDIQHVKSFLCGYYALYVADLLKKHIMSLTENKFDSLISNSFDEYPSKYNVDKITKWSIKKHIL